MDLPENLPLLDDEVLSGIGSGGQGFNTNRWRELIFLIGLTGEMKSHPPVERHRLMSSYDAFIEWIDNVPQLGNRQFKHMLRFFAFPDRVERMSSNRERCDVLVGFGVAALNECKNWNDRRLDEALLNLRKKLQQEFPEHILDFYEPPLLERWRQSESEKLKLAFQKVCDFCGSYPSVRGGLPTDDPRAQAVSNHLTTLADWLRQKYSQFNGVSIQTVICGGAGAFPRVPWICLLPPRQRVNDGIYVAICFGKGGNGAVVGCAESASTPKGLKTVQRAISGKVPAIDVDGIARGTQYNNGFQNPLEVFKEAFDPEKMLQHIVVSLRLALEATGTTPIIPKHFQEGKPLDEKLVTAFRTESSDSGLVVANELAHRFVSSILAKQFVVFTGLSGSGKSKIAQAFSRWITPKHANRSNDNLHFALIPVGADWTGNENIVGYPNGLNDGNYVTKPALELILHAANPAHKDIPHFLILDEMNLSHVERYFADLLSAIESGEEIPLYEGEVRTSNGKEIPHKLKIPENLFIIGTVNVDETTYMFSPKVLDRANVIEFCMDANDLAAFLVSPKKPNLEELDGKGVSYAKDFVAAAADKSRGVPDSVKADYEREMLLFFKMLQAHNTEFGYRIGYESARLVHFYKLLGGFADEDKDWFNGAMDCVIVQKFLPKLHGSRSKMEGLLWALAWACGAERSEDFLKECLEAGKAQDEGKFSPEKVLTEIGGGKARYPLSFEKVIRMWEKLKRDQFVSFAEA
jgi:energy-coupling factor transporter ATP-binding protein EcfA2